MFRKTLLDLVKGLRSNKADESAFINKCLAEIKDEVKDKDHAVKANAIQKLCYLYMCGYDISFAHFPIVEAMSQPSFTHRRAAFLAAALSFTDTTDVILLTPHLFKKAFSTTASSAGLSDPKLMEGLKYETGCAINCLANIVTPYLAETLLEDVYGMMNSSRPYLRKKAVLVLYSIFRKFPRALRLSFERLKSKLKDDDPGVQNAAVNVICELARKNPSNYLALLPQLFELLNNSNNNWMLIKLVKLLGSLIPAEPRLARKLHEPLTHIISNTPAKSLLYECINTATNCEVMSKSMVRLCLEKLRTFVEDPDQNLKYLGLLGLNRIMHQNVRAVAQHRDLILQCLDDPDITIRMRALDLITSMVNERNLEAIIQRLTDHLYGIDGSYRDHVLEQIILVCSKSDYEFVRDFAWYVQLLTNMTLLSSMSLRNAELVSTQLIDVTIRVPEVREFSVQQMIGLIVNNGLIGDSHNMHSNAICRVLRAAAYIVGEFAEHVEDHLTLVSAMLQSRISSLPGDIQCLFIHNALKVVCAGLEEIFEDEDEAEDEEEKEDKPDKTQESNDLVNGTLQLLEPLAGSQFIEVQERATAYLYFVKWLGPQIKESDDTEKVELVQSFAQLFSNELIPVHRKHQEIVAKKVPTGLKLDSWINDPWPESEGSEDELSDIEGQHFSDWFPEESDDDKKEKTKTQREKRKKRVQGPYYLGADDEEDAWRVKKDKMTEDEIDKIPQEVSEEVKGVKVFPSRSQRKRPKRGKSGKKRVVLGRVRMDGEDLSDEDRRGRPYDALAEDIDLTAPCDEEIPHLSAYSQQVPSLGKDAQQPLEKKGKRQGKKSRKERKKERKKGKKGKKGKKKGKKGAGGAEDAEQKYDEEAKDDAAEPSNDKPKKGKKGQKKGRKKGKKGKSAEIATEAQNGDANSAPPPKEEPAPDFMDDLFGFGDAPANAPDAAPPVVSEPAENGVSPKKKRKKQKASAEATDATFNPLDLFDMPDVGTAAPQTEEAHGESKSDVVDEPKKKSKRKKRKSGTAPDADVERPVEELLEENGIRITFTTAPGKRNSVDIQVTVANRSDELLKSVKMSVEGSPNLIPSKKSEGSISLAKKLEPEASCTCRVSLKCRGFDEPETLSCKVAYTFEGSKAKKRSDLALNIPTHAFFREAESVSHEDFLEMVDTEACRETATSKFRLNRSDSVAEALNRMALVWRLHEFESGDKTRTFVGNLLLDRRVAIYAKTSKSKRQIQLTVRTFSEDFALSLCEDIKLLLAP